MVGQGDIWDRGHLRHWDTWDRGHFVMSRRSSGELVEEETAGGFQRPSGVFLSWRGEVRRRGIPGRMMDREAGRGVRGNFSCLYFQYTRRAQQAGGDAKLACSENIW